MTPHVAWIHVAPIKALHIQERSSVELGPDGVADDRRFCIVDEADRMLNAKRVLRFVSVRPTLDLAMKHLVLAMPDGSSVEGDIELGEARTVAFPTRTVDARVVRGPWADALSEIAGRRVRLMRLERPGTGVDRADRGAVVTLLSVASLAALRSAAGAGAPIDPRRFRMLFGVAGVAAGEEDGWSGRSVRIGDALVVPIADVGRCVVTTAHPDTGLSDLDTLAALARYRSAGRTTERLPFGVWARVERGGTVRLGDAVTV